MTVESTITKIIYEGNGAATEFPVPFAFSRASDLRLLHTDADEVETPITDNFDVIVSIANDAKVTYPLDGPPLPIGEKLTIFRDTPQTQIVDLINGGDFNPNVLEYDGFDRIVMMIQEVWEEVKRSVRVPMSSQQTVEELIDKILSTPQGPPGIQGPIGPQGQQGPQGLPGEAAIANITYHGMWEPKEYVQSDCTISPVDGHSYVCIVESTPATEVPGYSTDWALWVQKGPMGPPGPEGPFGPQGQMGQRGQDGEPGPAGADGAPGLQGQPGPAGPVGPQGPTGPQGLPGEAAVANIIYKGLWTPGEYFQNDCAISSVDGNSYVCIVASTTEAPGPGAVDWAFWVQKGPQGPQGVGGPPGQQGPIGVTGAQGPQGTPGPQGPAGAAGAEGPAGPQGPQGQIGPQGPPGSFPAPSPSDDGKLLTAVLDGAGGATAQWESGVVNPTPNTVPLRDSGGRIKSALPATINDAATVESMGLWTTSGPRTINSGSILIFAHNAIGGVQYNALAGTTDLPPGKQNTFFEVIHGDDGGRSIIARNPGAGEIHLNHYSSGVWQGWKTLSPGACHVKAFGFIDGTGDILNSNNIAACSRPQTGVYRISLSIAAPHAFYTVLASGVAFAADNTYIVGEISGRFNEPARTNTTFSVRILNPTTAFNTRFNLAVIW